MLLAPQQPRQMVIPMIEARSQPPGRDHRNPLTDFKLTCDKDASVRTSQHHKQLTPR